MLPVFFLLLGVPVLLLILVVLLGGVAWTFGYRTGTERSSLLKRFGVGLLVWAVVALGSYPFLFFTYIAQHRARGGLENSGFTAKGGEPAPDFAFEPVGGEPARLSDLRGRPVVLNFFATWCGPCMAELPELDREIWQPFREKGLVVLVVGAGETQQNVAHFQHERGFSFLLAPRSRRRDFLPLWRAVDSAHRPHQPRRYDRLANRRLRSGGIAAPEVTGRKSARRTAGMISAIIARRA